MKSNSVLKLCQLKNKALQTVFLFLLLSNDIKAQATDTMDDYNYYYPKKEALFIDSIFINYDSTYTRFFIKSDFPSIEQFTLMINNRNLNQIYTGGYFDVQFDEKNDTIQRKLIKLILNKNEKKRPEFYKIKISYYPKKFYEKQGNFHQPGVMIMENSDIIVKRSLVSDWAYNKPSIEEKKKAIELWGKELSKNKSEYAKIEKLFKFLLDKMEPHRGVPSDSMLTDAIQQYNRIIKGKDKAWCTNLADIFIFACNALEIPCRRINIGHRFEGNNFWFYTGNGHATIEVFDAETNQWIWMDPTFNILGATIDGELLNFAQLYISITDSDLIKKIKLISYDPVKKRKERTSFKKASLIEELLSYFGANDQDIRYVKNSD